MRTRSPSKWLRLICLPPSKGEVISTQVLLTTIRALGSPEHIRENVATVALKDAEMALIDSIIANNPVVGDRFNAHGMKYTNV